MFQFKFQNFVAWLGARFQSDAWGTPGGIVCIYRLTYIATTHAKGIPKVAPIKN